MRRNYQLILILILVSIYMAGCRPYRSGDTMSSELLAIDYFTPEGERQPLRLILVTQFTGTQDDIIAQNLSNNLCLKLSAYTERLICNNNFSPEAIPSPIKEIIQQVRQDVTKYNGLSKGTLYEAEYKLQVNSLGVFSLLYYDQFWQGEDKYSRIGARLNILRTNDAYHLATVEEIIIEKCDWNQSFANMEDKLITNMVNKVRSQFMSRQKAFERKVKEQLRQQQELEKQMVREEKARLKLIKKKAAAQKEGFNKEEIIPFPKVKKETEALDINTTEPLQPIVTNTPQDNLLKKKTPLPVYITPPSILAEPTPKPESLEELKPDIIDVIQQTRRSLMERARITAQSHTPTPNPSALPGIINKR